MTAADMLDNNAQKKGRIPSSKILLWLALASITIMFGGLTSGYLVSQGNGIWLKFAMPQMFWVSTSIILLSSVTMNRVMSAAKSNNYTGVKTMLGITFGLGVLFVISQFLGFSEMVGEKIYFSGSSNSASFLYFFTGLHGAHILAGLIALIVVLVKSLKNRIDATNLLSLELCATYWHFLGGLWVYLFLFLLYFR